MAKISDKLRSAAERRAMKLRLKRDWIRTEQDALPAACQEKKEKIVIYQNLH